MMAGGSWGLEDRTRLTFAMVRKTERPLAEVDRLFSGEPGEVRRAYALSGALVRDVVLHYGRPAPRRILAAIARGESFAEAFRGATGTDSRRRHSTRSGSAIRSGIAGCRCWAARSRSGC